MFFHKVSLSIWSSTGNFSGSLSDFNLLWLDFTFNSSISFRWTIWHRSASPGSMSEPLKSLSLVLLIGFFSTIEQKLLCCAMPSCFWHGTSPVELGCSQVPWVPVLLVQLDFSFLHSFHCKSESSVPWERNQIDWLLFDYPDTVFFLLSLICPGQGGHWTIWRPQAFT